MMAPELPDEVVPDVNFILPLAPLVPASTDVMVMAPDVVADPAPDEITIAPPVAAVPTPPTMVAAAPVVAP